MGFFNEFLIYSAISSGGIKIAIDRRNLLQGTAMQSQFFTLPCGETIALEIPDEVLNQDLTPEEQQEILDAVAEMVFGLVDGWHTFRPESGLNAA
jgi:hypothetical protein